MKIGIIGPADRAAAWENHLRPHKSISEVVITSKINDVGAVDACLLLDDGENRLYHLLEAVKLGYHTFLISPLPIDTEGVEKVYHAAEESNVLLQFSHWPTLAPSSKWMSQNISKPDFIQINREIAHPEFLESGHSFDYYWIDELAFCLRYIPGEVHHLDLKPVTMKKDQVYIFHLFLRFDSGATASIYVNAAASRTWHQRVCADTNFILECDVLEQTVRIGEQKGDSRRLFFKRETFDATRSAELAIQEFIKSIQLNRPTIYNGYHLMKLTKTIDQIKHRLSRA